MDEVLMTIGEIAAFFDLSVKSLRIYERKGILQPEKVDDKTGYRYYFADQVRHLDSILELKRYGFSLSEIQQMTDGDLTKEKHIQQLESKKSVWQNSVAKAKEKISEINHIISRLENSEPATKLHELTDEERARLLNGLECLKDREIPHVILEALFL